MAHATGEPSDMKILMVADDKKLYRLVADYYLPKTFSALFTKILA